MNITRTKTISNEEYIEMLKPYDAVYAKRLEEGMKSFEEIETFDSDK